MTLKIGKLPLNGTPRIAAGFKDHTPLGLIRKARKGGLDIAEMRIDQYASFARGHVLKEIAKFKDFPKIATIRSRKEGGNWNLSEKERLALFAAVLPKVQAVDIELSSTAILGAVVKAARAAGKTVIISYHNFKQTPKPAVLNKTLRQAKARGADIVKIAAMARKRADVQALAVFTRDNADQNLITISMGERGSVSRVAFPALGSLITYASCGGTTAPGQLSYDKTAALLKVIYS